MTRPPRPTTENVPPAGFYDADPAGEDDLWFMPAPIDEDVSPADPPWPMAPRAPEHGADDWQAGEAAHAGALARAAMAVGALDERVRNGPPGWRRRLICMEVSDLGWHLGDRVSVDRLGLYLVLRLTGVHDDAHAIARAAWAVRRLEREGPLDLGDLAGYLGREPLSAEGERAADTDLMTRPLGTEFEALAEEWRGRIAKGAALHPITRASLAWSSWRRAGLSGEQAQIEGAVIAARLAGEALRDGGLGFVPLALGGSAALRALGSPRLSLPQWYEGIALAALRGLMECDRLADWEARARAAISDLSGRTPGRLLSALTEWPLASAPMLEKETGASRAAVQRNMLIFEARGLVHEVTGQARFRFWQAAVR